jgi:predicted metal-binding membrane protein
MADQPRTTTRTTAIALPATLAVAAACWALTVRQMAGMDIGPDAELGSFGFFLGVWVPMMAAMMLPGAAPALARYTQIDTRVYGATTFVASYLTVWTLVGIAVYAVYEPHGTTAAGALVMAAGLYELTPMKRDFRRRCQARLSSGLEFGLCCVGSSIGLMVMLIALGVMSLGWMSVIAAVVLIQKVLPAKPVLDVLLAVAIIALGLVIVLNPGSVPGLTPAM